jgi:hypothetical protein
MRHMVAQLIVSRNGKPHKNGTLLPFAFPSVLLGMEKRSDTYILAAAVAAAFITVIIFSVAGSFYMNSMTAHEPRESVSLSTTAS